MKCFLFVCLFAITFARNAQSENAKLRKTNQALIEALQELAVGSQADAERGVAEVKDCDSDAECPDGYYCKANWFLGTDTCELKQDTTSVKSTELKDCDSDAECPDGYYCKTNWFLGKDTCELKQEKAVGHPDSGPSRDCYSFDKDCNGCRGYLESCCSNKNCGGGRQCKAGMWSYSCDNSMAEQEESVGFGIGKYKCTARNNCIYECQEDDESKSWYACMKECPKSLCDKDSTSDSIDPEDDSEEEAVGLTCSKDGFEGTVTSDSWCDKRSGVWMHKCSDCKHGYYWYWWHTYCCTRGKSGCTCAYN